MTRLFLNINTPLILDTTANSIYELLARSDDYLLNIGQLSLTVLGSRIFLTRNEVKA